MRNFEKDHTNFLFDKVKICGTTFSYLIKKKLPKLDFWGSVISVISCRYNFLKVYRSFHDTHSTNFKLCVLLIQSTTELAALPMESPLIFILFQVLRCLLKFVYFYASSSSFLELVIGNFIFFKNVCVIRFDKWPKLNASLVTQKFPFFFPISTTAA